MFGNAIGQRVKSVKEAWKSACAKAELVGFQLRDLRHEAGSRFDEAGIPTNYVSKLLGHASLTTTTRYLNINRRGLHLAMEKLEQSLKERESVAQRVRRPHKPLCPKDAQLIPTSLSFPNSW